MVLQVGLNAQQTSIPIKFVQRSIEVTFILGPPSAGQPSPSFSGNSNQVTLSGLRISARIIKAGGRSMGEAQLQIYGMTLSLMNQLSTLGQRIQLVPRNGIIVKAGDLGGTLATVFQGTITQAWADFQGIPDVPFHVEAHTGLAQAVISAPPTSWPSNSDVATIMNSLATNANLAFENNNVKQTIPTSYFTGSVRDQIMQCKETAGINAFIDYGNLSNNGTLIIWPKNGSRGGFIPVISPETGMVGYPSFTAMGIVVKSLFNPSIGYGGKIQIQSSAIPTNPGTTIPKATLPANGIWAVYKLDHDLESQVPHGKWFSEIGAYNPAFTPPAPTA
jgi:hypothetical protein